MAANKKSLLASLIKELVGTKTAQSSKENDEKKKKLVAETIKETASTSGGNGDNAAIMKILNMLETQLNVKTSALEEEASKRRDAELEVQKLRQDLIKLENEQKLDDNSKTLATIHTLIDAMASEDDDNKGKSKKKNFKVEGKQNFQQGSRGNKGNGGYSGPNKSNTTEKNNDGNQSGSKPNFGGNLNTPDQSKKNKCQNKKFDQQNYPHPNKNFNQVRNTIPPLLNQPHFNQSNNINQPPGNQGPMNNFNPTTNTNPLLGNVIQHPPHFNPPQFNSYHNQNPYPQQPNNFVPYTQPRPNIPPGGLHQFGSFPNQGRNVQQPYQQQGVQQPYQQQGVQPPYHQQGRNFRGRGGNFTRGRGNFRGNARGGVNIGKQFGGNNSSVKGGAQEKDGFVFVSKSDISSNAKNPDTNITSNHVVNDGHEQNNQLQKTNFKKKRNRKNRAERQNKDEKEKDEDFDSESVMQGMMDVFSKMFGNVVAQQQQSTKTKNDEPQQPIQSKNVEPQLPPSNPKDVEPPSPKSVTSTVNTGPNQQTGAIKKDVIPGKTRNKANKQKEGNQQIKDIKETKTNPLKLFVGSGFPSEEEAKDKNINLNQEVKDLIMVAKFEGNSITEQPKTLRDMTNFKKKYPNASAIVIKDEQ